jgi:plasmid stabilization system protein ParE
MKPIILKLAGNDLKEIREKLSEFGSNPPRKFRDSFEAFCANITNMPLMYPQYNSNSKYRKAVIKYDYIVLYQVDSSESNGRAKIYRVLHGKRDILSALEEDE